MTFSRGLKWMRRQPQRPPEKRSFNEPVSWQNEKEYRENLEMRYQLPRLVKTWLLLTLVLCALSLLSGCSVFTREVVRTETVEVPVPVQVPLPAELTAPCTTTVELEPPVTFEEYARWVEDLALTLEQCNKEKAAIRKLQPST